MDLDLRTLFVTLDYKSNVLEWWISGCCSLAKQQGAGSLASASYHRKIAQDFQPVRLSQEDQTFSSRCLGRDEHLHHHHRKHVVLRNMLCRRLKSDASEAERELL